MTVETDPPETDEAPEPDWWGKADPDWAAVAAATVTLKTFAAAISKMDGHRLPEKERALLMHRFMLQDGYSTTMRDAVAIMSSRKMLSWNASSGAFAALAMLLFDMPKSRAYAYSYALKLFKDFDVEFVKKKLEDHSFDYWARMPKTKRDRQRKIWLKQQERQPQP